MAGAWLGIDPGTRRFGLARRDPLGITITPLPILKVDTKFPQSLFELIDSGGYAGVVMGLPLNNDGEETRVSAISRGMAAQITEKTGLPVHFQNERFSSQVAEDMLTDKKVKRAEISRVKDSLAAALILEWYFDGR